MKLKILMTLSLVALFLGSMTFVMAEHNDEFPENGCDVADHTINVSAEGEELHFLIGGEENPVVEVGKGSCVKVVFDNTSDLDHDFTVVDESVDEEEEFHELIHMDTDAGTKTEHLWQMPDKDVTLEYFCEVPGHRDGGMVGEFVIGEGDAGFLPGFSLPLAFLALFAMIAIPTIRRRM